MAHLWTLAGDGSWAPVVLDGAAFALGVSGRARMSDATPQDHDHLVTATLHRTITDEAWVLLVPARAPVRVNGAPAPLGIVALADRDEIRVVPGWRMFFSTERLASVALYPTSGQRGFCPRCRQSIDPGALAVACPGCGLWHHQSDALACWTYADRCAACAQATALDAGFRWTPEEL